MTLRKKHSKGEQVEMCKRALPPREKNPVVIINGWLLP